MADGDNIYTVLGKPWVSLPLIALIGGLVAHLFGVTEDVVEITRAWVGLVPEVPDINIGGE